MFHKTTTSIQIRTDDINNRHLINIFLTASNLKKKAAEVILLDRGAIFNRNYKGA